MITYDIIHDGYSYLFKLFVFDEIWESKKKKKKEEKEEKEEKEKEKRKKKEKKSIHQVNKGVFLKKTFPKEVKPSLRLKQLNRCSSAKAQKAKREREALKSWRS